LEKESNCENEIKATVDYALRTRPQQIPSVVAVCRIVLIAAEAPEFPQWS